MPRSRGLMTACAVVFFSSAAALCADVLYVDAAATGASDGVELDRRLHGPPGRARRRGRDG